MTWKMNNELLFVLLPTKKTLTRTRESPFANAGVLIKALSFNVSWCHNLEEKERKKFDNYQSISITDKVITNKTRGQKNKNKKKQGKKSFWIQCTIFQTQHSKSNTQLQYQIATTLSTSTWLLTCLWCLCSLQLRLL